jgi:hypothetical protein
MEQPQSADDLKREIVTQIAELSRLLGMMSSDDIIVQKAGEAHLKLSILVGRALDIPMP